MLAIGLVPGSLVNSAKGCSRDSGFVEDEKTFLKTHGILFLVQKEMVSLSTNLKTDM